jgi:hypothetical protein
LVLAMSQPKPTRQKTAPDDEDLSQTLR